MIVSIISYSLAAKRSTRVSNKLLIFVNIFNNPFNFWLMIIFLLSYPNINRSTTTTIILTWVTIGSTLTFSILLLLLSHLKIHSSSAYLRNIILVSWSIHICHLMMSIIVIISSEVRMIDFSIFWSIYVIIRNICSLRLIMRPLSTLSSLIFIIVCELQNLCYSRIDRVTECCEHVHLFSAEFKSLSAANLAVPNLFITEIRSCNHLVVARRFHCTVQIDPSYFLLSKRLCSVSVAFLILLSEFRGHLWIYSLLIMSPLPLFLFLTLLLASLSGLLEWRLFIVFLRKQVPAALFMDSIALRSGRSVSCRSVVDKAVPLVFRTIKLIFWSDGSDASIFLNLMMGCCLLWNKVNASRGFQIDWLLVMMTQKMVIVSDWLVMGMWSLIIWRQSVSLDRRLTTLKSSLVIANLTSRIRRRHHWWGLKK